MTPSHANKRGVRYRYYVSRPLMEGEKERAGTPSRISATEIETLVIAGLREKLSSDHLPRVRTDSDLVETLVDTVQVFCNHVSVTLVEAGGQHSDSSEPGDHAATTLRLPCCLGTQRAERKVIPIQPAADDRPFQLNGPRSGNRRRLLESIYRPRGWLDELLKGTVMSIEAIAERKARSERNVSMFLNLAMLAPELVDAALDDKLPPTLSASHLAQTLPLDWTEQRKMMLSQGRG